MPTKNGITIFFVPHDRKKGFSVRLKAWQVVLALVVLITGTVLFLIGIFLGGKSAALIAENRTLKAENNKLFEQRAKIVRLENELAKNSRMRGWIEEMIGVQGNDDALQIVSLDDKDVGLPILMGTAFTPRLFPELADEAQKQIRRLDFIPRGLPVKGAITAQFGEMGPNFLLPHSGVDIAAPEGNIVKATAAGIITEIKWDNDLGLVVTVNHLNSYKTRYGHLSFSSCQVGDWVEPGDKIGTVGTTGHARGPHVHYELWYENEKIDPLKDKKS